MGPLNEKNWCKRTRGGEIQSAKKNSPREKKIVNRTKEGKRGSKPEKRGLVNLNRQRLKRTKDKQTEAFMNPEGSKNCCEGNEKGQVEGDHKRLGG